MTTQAAATIANPSTAEDTTTALVRLAEIATELTALLDGIEMAEDRIAEHARAQQVRAQDAARYANQIVDAVATAAGHVRHATTAIDTARRRATKLVTVQDDARRGRY